MRAGGCTVQQALTPEAATIVKQAVTLARRRGHAQVTPLHVASTMLSSSTGLLRAACLQSHSYPLQCKALELCFNVALNRLPASAASAPMLGSGHHHYHHHHHHAPSLSNALVAAFKRAQAHQRRGSIENQQQPLLAVKIELEQLIISILDDPSVSRVMREAGFSSTQVKSNVELAVSSSSSSMEMCASGTPSSSPRKAAKVDTAIISPFATPPQGINQPRPSVQVKNEDLMCVIEGLSGNKKRSLVIVGECLETSDGVVKGVMERIEKGEVPEALKGVTIISLPLFSLKDMSREEVEHKFGELRCRVNSFFCHGHGGRSGVVLYLGDLKWASEQNRGEKAGGRRSSYCPMEHVIMEIRSMAFGGRFWVLGIATYQTFMKCSVGYPSLGSLWDLQPLTMPSGSLNLSLSFDSDSRSRSNSEVSGNGSLWSLMENGDQRSHLSCCADCSLNFETEARNLPNNSQTLPSWLQQYKQENRRATDDQGCLAMRDLCRKWNTICSSSSHRSLQQHPSEITFNFSSASPSYSISSDDQRYADLHRNRQPWLLPFESKKYPWREHHFKENVEQRLYNPNSTSSSGTIKTEHVSKFKELNAENLKILCNALERRVGWQKDIIPEIASTILQCRSGMMISRRKLDKSSSAEMIIAKEETWMFFRGGDNKGKERIARELANLIFGSHSNFVSIGLSTFSSTRSGSSDDIVRSKRSRADQASHGYLERLFEAIREDPHRVVLMEDIEQVDSRTQHGIRTAIERGKIKSNNGEEVSVDDAIIILSCESFDCRSRACSPRAKCKAASHDDEKKEEEEAAAAAACEKEVSSGCSLPLDLNLSAEEENPDDYSCEEVKLLDLVDRAFFFKLPEDS